MERLKQNSAQSPLTNSSRHSRVLLCSSCTSPGLRANAVPTSRYVEIGLCELATSRRLSSPIGPLLGSICRLKYSSTSSSTGSASNSGDGVLLRRRFTFVHPCDRRLAPPRPAVDGFGVLLPLGTARRPARPGAARSRASSFGGGEAVSSQLRGLPRRLGVPASSALSGDAQPSSIVARLACAKAMHDLAWSLFPGHYTAVLWGHNLAAATQDLNDKYFPAKTRPYSFPRGGRLVWVTRLSGNLLHGHFFPATTRRYLGVTTCSGHSGPGRQIFSGQNKAVLVGGNFLHTLQWQSPAWQLFPGDKTKPILESRGSLQ